MPRLPGRAGVVLGLVSLMAAPAPAPAAFVESATGYGIAEGDSMSYAAGFVDFDGDGDPDLYVNNHWKSQADLYRNDGGTFVEMSDHFEGASKDRHDQLWGDFDNDGDPDQYIAHSQSQNNELYWSSGQGAFVEGAIAAGVGDFDGRGREIALADFNQDQLLDIFLANDYRLGFLRPNALFWNDGDGTFSRHPNDDPIFRSRQHVSAGDWDLDGDVDVLVTDPPWASGEFWRSNGDSTWTDVTATAFPGITLPLGQAQALSWADYDNDGDLDLLACGGNRGVWDHVGLEGDSLRYYIESDSAVIKPITFTTDGDSVSVDAIAADYGPLTCYYGSSGNAVTVFPASLEVDQLAGEPPDLAGGAQGLFLWSTTGAGADTVHFRVGGPGPSPLRAGGALRANGSGILTWSSAIDPPPPYSSHDWSNRLYRNEGNLTFSEVTTQAFGVNGTSTNSKGAAWGDYDNDGWIDVYIANGGTVATGNQANYLCRNNGDGTFTDVAALEGVQGSTVGMSDGGNWADVDGDGFLDLFVDNGAEHPPFGVGPRELFINSPNPNHWISFHLRGLISNGSGIGARVRVVSRKGGPTAAESRWRTRLGESDNGFSNDPMLHFGLGDHTKVDTVEVVWPSGQVDTHENVALDLEYYAVEGDSLRVAVDPYFVVTSGAVADSIVMGGSSTHAVSVDNLGGLAADYGARYEDCTGQTISWMSVDPEASTVFPGGTDPLELTIDASGLLLGDYCARVIFATEGPFGPDTLGVNVTVHLPTGTDATGLAPDRFRLGAPRPNPSRGNVQMVLELPEATHSEVAIYDVAGRRVASLVSASLPAGRHALSWDFRNHHGRPVGGGVYFIRAVAGAEHATRKLVVLD